MSHQAGAGAREPCQHLSVADRRDREQSAVAEGKERSTSGGELDAMLRIGVGLLIGGALLAAAAALAITVGIRRRR